MQALNDIEYPLTKRRSAAAFVPKWLPGTELTHSCIAPTPPASASRQRQVWLAVVHIPVVVAYVFEKA
jgi:hypothetical protein